MKKSFLGILVLFIGINACAHVSNREKWETITVKKQGWPVESWSYKRCAGQGFVWAAFGNDNDGVTPWFEGKQWPFWKWWLRNRWHNLNWFVRGYTWWEEGNPYAAWNTDHLRYKIICGKDPPDDDAPGWQIRFLKPKKRSFFYWRPFICYNGKWIRFWWGWKRRGQFARSFHFGGEENQ